MKTNPSRRIFFKNSAVVSASLIAGTGLFNQACSNPDRNAGEEASPLFRSKEFKPGEGVAGLLFSQIGYELDYPVRIIVRMPRKGPVIGKSTLPAHSHLDRKKTQHQWHVLGENLG